MMFPYMYTPYSDQIHPLYFSFLSHLLPFFKQSLMVFIILCSYEYKVLWIYLCPLHFCLLLSSHALVPTLK
jgi:hypothetical protein